MRSIRERRTSEDGLSLVYRQRMLLLKHQTERNIMNNPLFQNLPKIGLRPAIDGRVGGFPRLRQFRSALQLKTAAFAAMRPNASQCQACVCPAIFTSHSEMITSQKSCHCVPLQRS
jgi:hypothetical protein